MAIIVILITISLSIAVLFLGIFYWNIRSGQYDDTYTPSVRMLFENKVDENNTQNKERSKKRLKKPSHNDAPEGGGLLN